MNADPPVRPDGRCQCGCGNAAPIARSNHRRKGHIKGQPVRFINGHNNRGVPKSPETRARMRAAWEGIPRPWLRGPRPASWGDGLSPQAAHIFLARHYPKTGACSSCGKTGWTDYAFLHHPAAHTRNRKDYAELCRSYHVAFDYANGTRGGKKA